MSLRAILEILVHLESFRNVDLFHQGIYCLKISIFHYDRNQQRIPAQPYSITQSQNQQRRRNNQNNDYHNIIPSYIEDQDNTLVTRSFLIRYCEEIAEINDICQFRTEIETSNNYLQTPLHLEVDMLFADLLDLGGADKWQSFIADQQNQIEFKLLSTQKFTINNPLSGISEFFQIVFDENHFSVCSGQIHTSLIDYRFRMAQFVKKQKEEFSQFQNEKQQKGENLNLNSMPQTLADFLFQDSNGKIPQEIDEMKMNQIH